MQLLHDQAAWESYSRPSVAVSASWPLVDLRDLLRASCGNHRCHQVDSFGAVESVLSDQRAPSPEPNRESDRGADAGAPPASLSPSPHQRGVHCRELALQALDRRF